jgi:eukaryotic-like serine/threonine-protein kinase
MARSVVTAGRLVAGRYQIERLLGGGGMATVWSGRDLRLDRPVAIKKLSGEGLRQPKALERFDREARAVGRLSHPNVVAVYDFGIQGSEPYLVMELVQGPTVAMLLADGPLPVVDVLAVGSQVCDGLEAAHAAGIVHRDIKPANLILAANGVVKICDFGVARLLDTAGNGNLTGPATAMGSPSYMAPEQIGAGPVDPRTDLYALGCTMYAMLVGHPPFTAGGPFGIVHQHITRPPGPLRLRRPDAPLEVEALVDELLAKRPDERPPDAATVRARIAAAQADPAIAATPFDLPRAAIASPVQAEPGALAILTRETSSAGPSYGARALATRRRLWAIAAVGVAALAAVVIAMAVLPTARSATGGGAGRQTRSTAPVAASPSPGAVASPTAAGSSRMPVSAVPPPASPAPTGTGAPSSPPTDPIVALHQAIGQQVVAGNLKPDAATDLNHAVDDLAKTIATGNTAEVTNKLQALRDKLTTLNKEGKLNADGYRALNSAVDQVAAAQG